MRNQLKRTPARALKSLVALMMVLCLLMGTVPMAFAAKSVGTSSSSVSASATKVYIKLSASVPFFTGELYGTGTTIKPAAGTVCQLVSDDWYTGSDNKEYYSVFYLSQRYNVLKSDVEKDVMTAAELEAYITGTLWKQTVYATLRKSMELKGDVRVHAVQLALQKLGYYKGALDGSYGTQTHNAVKQFQRDKGLDADGSAGPLTQPVLFALASGSTVSGSTSSGSTSSGSTSSGSTSSGASTGTLRTIAEVNLRKYGSTNSARLAVVPRNVNLSYTDTYSGSNGVIWYQVRYASQTGWVMGTYVNVTSGGSTGSGSGTTTGGIGTLKTSVKVNLRKNASTGSARLAVVPKSVSLSYTDTYRDSKGITWYQVRYAGQTGWLMGTFVNASGSTSSGSSSGSSSSTGAIGKVTITKPGTRVRDAANGNKTGYVLSKGAVVDLLSQPTSAGGYTWYNIRTSSGLVGYVRGDCATASIGSNSGNLTVSADKTFIKLPANTALFTTETKPSSGAVNVAAGTVLMMYSTDTYTVSDVQYCTLYYNNQKYNAVYSEVKGGIMTTEAVADYVTELLNGNLTYTLKRELDLVGDVRVYALQVALESLDYYTGKLDGDFGAGTQSAVRNFQRAAKIEVDGACGNETWAALRAAITGSGSSDGTGSGTTITDFGAVTSVQKASWDKDGINLIPKGSYATILDVKTEKVFRVYRWSGGNHADCVPATRADTKVMCDIVGFTYNDNAPTSSQLAKIMGYAKGTETENYAWPDFGGHFGGKDIGSAWDRRPALLKVDGSTKVYAVSIYGFPHGFEGGSDSFSNSIFPNGTKFYAGNNYYGMMCIHFVGSTTHTSTTPDTKHQEAIGDAYDYAKKKWPDLVK